MQRFTVVHIGLESRIEAFTLFTEIALLVLLVVSFANLFNVLTLKRRHHMSTPGPGQTLLTATIAGAATVASALSNTAAGVETFLKNPPAGVPDATLGDLAAELQIQLTTIGDAQQAMAKALEDATAPPPPPAVLSISPNPPPVPVAGTPYAVTFIPAGEAGTVTAAVTAGSLPAGASLTDLTLSGYTPVSGDSLSYTLTFTDQSTPPQTVEMIVVQIVP